MSKFEGVLMGMGNPLLDISATVGQDVLDKYGVKLDSAILADKEHMPVYDDLKNNYDPQFIAGGATQNSIRVAQWMLKKKGQAAFMGCVSDDVNGKKLEECATADGVFVHYMKSTSNPTGTCACLIKDGERALIANLAAANDFEPSHLQTEKAKEIIETAKFYYIAGFFLTASFESYLEVAEHANAKGKTLCLNLSAPFLIDFFTDQMTKAMSLANFLFGNESEAAALGAKLGLGSDLKELAIKVSDMLCKKEGLPEPTVVFTQGSKSTIVARGGVVTEYAVEALGEGELVDTNGAGDAFVGGFLSQLVQGKGIAECVNAGHWGARFIIKTSGTQLPKTCDCPDTF